MEEELVETCCQFSASELLNTNGSSTVYLSMNHNYFKGLSACRVKARLRAICDAMPERTPDAMWIRGVCAALSGAMPTVCNRHDLASPLSLALNLISHSLHKL